jgi:hypothetical protein
MEPSLEVFDFIYFFIKVPFSAKDQDVGIPCPGCPRRALNLGESSGQHG